MKQTIYAETRTPPQGKVSFEEFLEWLDEDTHAEWVDGEVILKMPVSVEHRDVNNYLHFLISAWVARAQRGKAYQPPLLVKFTPPDGKRVAREPDIVVILNSNPGAFTEQYFEGVPDLIVEVVSPRRRNVDRLTKFEEYESAGVPEYWVIDPERQYAEFFQLDESGAYRTRAARRVSIAVACWRGSGWRCAGYGSVRPCGMCWSSWGLCEKRV